jgi:Glycosyltransferase family 6
MKIAILYIATGKYIIFWKDFFATCEKYFLTGYHKEYFVFTDATEFEQCTNDRVHTIPHKQLGWPYDTLMRFHIFSGIKEQLKTFDYIFFFNSNMVFMQLVTAAEFLPDGKNDDGLLVTLHPGYFNQSRPDFPYEQEQSASKAYIKKDEGKHYFMGGLNGGTSQAYLQLIESLKDNTQADLDNNIIARWHDESQLNKYMLDKNPKILSPAYGYPEDRKLPFQPIIIIRDKNKFGGHSFLRNEKRSLLGRIKFYLKKIKKKF